MLYIFDTDHLTLYQHYYPAVVERVRNLDYSIHAVVTTVINSQEQIGGRFEQVNRAKNLAALLAAYQFTKTTIEFFQTWEILPYDDRAEFSFQAARKAGVRIGKMD